MMARSGFPSPLRATGLAVLLTWGLVGLSGCDEVAVRVIEVEAVELEPDPVELLEGESVEVSATMRIEGGRILSGRPVEWTSDDPSLVTVSATGRLDAHLAGTTRVRARAGRAEGSAQVTVSPGPAIALSAESLSLEGVSGEEAEVEGEVAVTNGGGGVLADLGVEIVSSDAATAGWLLAELDGTQAPTTLRVRGVARDLAPGSYGALLRVDGATARLGPVDLPVVFEVLDPPPLIQVSPGSVALSGVQGSREPATEVLEVRNAGGGELTGLTVSVRQGPGTVWLEAELLGTSAPTEVLVRAWSRELAPGEYTGTVVIGAPGAGNSPREVNVRFTVGGP